MKKNNLDISYDKTKNEEYDLPCINCEGKTVHKVLSSINVEGSEDIDWNFSIDYWDDYEIIQCQGCKLISFRKNNRNTEDTGGFVDDEGNYITELLDNEQLFPSRMLGRKKLKKVSLIPYEVRRIYNETYNAISENLCILSAIGIRALIEAICLEKVASGRNLQAKIDNLKTMGILTQEDSNILHSIRLLGNVAAHEVDPPSLEILNTAFEIVESLLRNVYIIPVIAKKLIQS